MVQAVQAVPAPNVRSLAMVSVLRRTLDGGAVMKNRFQYFADVDVDQPNCPVVRNYRKEVIAYCTSKTTSVRIARALNAQRAATVKRRQARLKFEASLPKYS